MLELLQSHLAHSTMQQDSHFVVKDVDANIQANIKTSYDDAEQQNLWKLVYSLWGKSDFSSSSVPDGVEGNDRTMSSHMVRKLLVGQWLAQALTFPIEDSVKVHTHRVYFILIIIYLFFSRKQSLKGTLC